MDYNQALEYIHGTRKFGIKLGLRNIKILLDLMGDPHKKLSFIHIAGTNGKGSTAAFISQILIEAGYRVGVFTSPYLEKFTERIKINNFEIKESDLAKITDLVRQKVNIMKSMELDHPTEFEIVTAIGFQYFYEKNCDIVVLEVGLGGRFDSTNIIDTPLISVITSIDYDHTDRLGHSLKEIALEKAGIIKQKGDLVVYPQVDSIYKILKQVCISKKTNIHRIRNSDVIIRESGIKGQVFDYDSYKLLMIKQLGEYQSTNAAVSVKVCELLNKKGYTVTRNHIRQGLKKVKWPGRMEIIKDKPLFIIDAAHNSQGAEKLCESLQKLFTGKRIIFIMGVLKDKDYESMVKKIAPIAETFIAVTPLCKKRALTADCLAESMKCYCKKVYVSDTIRTGMDKALELAQPEDIICAFGSFYHIGKVRSLICSEYRHTDI